MERMRHCVYAEKRMLRRPHPAQRENNMWRIHYTNTSLPTRKEVSVVGPTWGGRSFYKHSDWWPSRAQGKTQVYRQENHTVENASYGITVQESLHMEHQASSTWADLKGNASWGLALNSSAKFNCHRVLKGKTSPGFAGPGSSRGQKSTHYHVKEGKGAVCKWNTWPVACCLPVCT